ncbi:hypothetical protein PRIPAC_71210 [Pristionchus pacificus]|uniref:Transmembrane ion channel n=1 Tax=Pristionchus pacificus TaxID=54126 RepID=A0A2A6C6W4_PRIPA|nr:hypothetical protein PRIPAC_71210 [Pristionchus pacificus]|eukprot:PDM73793.1 transmembrane ion channel [Pristionchus pacificus]
MARWVVVVVALALSSSLVEGDPPPSNSPNPPNPTAAATQPKLQKMTVLCRTRDGSHIVANDIAPRIVKRAKKRDTPPTDPAPAPAPITVDFRFSCKNPVVVLLCPAITNMFLDIEHAKLVALIIDFCQGLGNLEIPCVCNEYEECGIPLAPPDSEGDISFFNHDNIPNDDPVPPGQEPAATLVPSPPPECTNELPAEGQTCRYKVATEKECFNKCGRLINQYDCSPIISKAEDGSLLCTIDNLKPKYFKSHGTHFEKLIKRIQERSSPSIAPMIFLQSDTDAVKHSVVVIPVAARITEVNEKDQTDRFTSQLEFERVRKHYESIWRPPLFPKNMLSFSNEDVLKSNVKVLSTGKVFDNTIWNFKIAADMNFDYFPYDSQSFEVIISSTQEDLKLLGPDYIITATENPSEWAIIEDFVKLETKNNQTLAYKVVIKRYPYFWNILIIVPCFILGFLVIAALTIGADSNSIESLVNIGLAASVASAVNWQLLIAAYFVRNQFLVIVTVLVTLSIRKAVMPLIDAKLAAWRKPEAGAELSSSKKAIITAVKVARHRLLFFVIFGVTYAGSFGLMMSHADYNFERKKRAFVTGMEHHKIFSRNT